VHRSIVKKRFSLAVLPQLEPLGFSSKYSGPIVNQLVIVGAPRQKKFKRKPDPTLLVVYPSDPLILDPQDFQQLPSFCFPRGFDEVSGLEVKSDPIQEQFVFAMKDGVYGVCTTCCFVNSRDAFFYNSASKAFPTCFCYLTTNPALSAIFQVESFLVKWIGGSHSSVIQHTFSPEGKHRPSKIPPGLVQAGPALRMDGFLIPKVFLQELGFIRSIAADPFDDRPVQLSKHESVVIPMQDALDRSISYVGMDVLFTRMSVANIVRAVSILLLEKHVVFVSNSVLVLSLCVLCLRELCEPFCSEATFLPVLPASPLFFPILESPVPFVCGLLKPAPPLPDYVVRIDLDDNRIIDPDESPVIAGADALVERLNRLLTEQSPDVLIPRRPIGRSRSQSVSREALASHSSRGKSKAKSPPRPSADADWIEFVRTRLHPYQDPPLFGRIQHKYILGPMLVEAVLGYFRTSLEMELEVLMRPYFITDTTDIEHPAADINSRALLLKTLAVADKQNVSADVVPALEVEVTSASYLCWIRSSLLWSALGVRGIRLSSRFWIVVSETIKGIKSRSVIRCFRIDLGLKCESDHNAGEEIQWGDA
jgi:hypothetical protein